MTNIATKEERILDTNYSAAFILNKAQVESHVCSDDPNRKNLSVMRVCKDDEDNIVTESTDGKTLMQIKEKSSRFGIEHYPLDVNPSETSKILLDEPQFIPSTVLDELAKGFPRRKNFCAQPWQRSVVVSVNTKANTIECGRSNKQGRPQVDSFEKSSVTVFPPVEDVWPEKIKGDPSVIAAFDLAALKRVVNAMEAAGAELVRLKLWDNRTALQLESVNKQGNKTEREINALLMPFALA